MGEFLDYFRQKKNLINLLLLGIVMLSLPLAVQTLHQQQILKSRAANGDIVFTGDNVFDIAGKKVFKLDSEGKAIVGLELTSPKDDPPIVAQSDNILMSLVPRGLVRTVSADSAGDCDSHGGLAGEDDICDTGQGLKVHVFNCNDGSQLPGAVVGTCEKNNPAPPAGNPPPASNGDWWGCSGWDTYCEDKSRTCRTDDGKAGVVCSHTCNACGTGDPKWYKQGVSSNGQCYAGLKWDVCVAANQDTQGGPCKETATLTSDCAMCIYKEKNKATGGNLYDTVRGMDVQRLAQCNYEQTASVWCNEVDQAGCESIKKGACSQPTAASGTYPASKNCSTGSIPPTQNPPVNNPPSSGGPSTGGKLDCKTSLEPSELGINNSNVCDRLHQYVLVNKDGSDSTCATNNTCTENEDCPQNKSDPDHITDSGSAWCYGFKDGARCVQLRYTGKAVEPGCAPGEGNGGPNACTNLDACSKCILTTKDTIIPYYASNGRDTSCNSLGTITNEWCSSVDPTGCQSLKSGACVSACSASVPPGSVTTVSYRIAESTAEFSETGKYGWQTYSSPVKTTFEFKDANPGPKNIVVEFKYSDGKKEQRKNQIRLLSPDPAVTSCSLSFEANNTTVLNLTGTNFGTVKGTIKSGDTDLSGIKQWKDKSIKVAFLNAPEGEKLPVILTNTDGQSSQEVQCSAIAQLSLGAKVFCRTSSSQDTPNVDLALTGDFAGGTKAKQKVTIDREGNIQGLTQRLEDGKNYKLSLKAPKSVRKTVSFTAGSGTTSIPNFVLPVGDIFPTLSGDGTINNFDKSELNRQWIIAQSASGRSGDFNGDGRVNSIDWACMRYDFGSSDDVEPVAPLATAVPAAASIAAPAAGIGATDPAGVGNTASQ